MGALCFQGSAARSAPEETKGSVRKQHAFGSAGNPRVHQHHCARYKGSQGATERRLPHAFEENTAVAYPRLVVAWSPAIAETEQVKVLIIDLSVCSAPDRWFPVRVTIFPSPSGAGIPGLKHCSLLLSRWAHSGACGTRTASRAQGRCCQWNEEAVQIL